MWRLIYAIPSWILFLLVRTLFIILGWVLIPIAVICRAYAIIGVTNHGGDKWGFTWKFMDALYGNKEDGIAEGWQYWDTGAVWSQIIYWSAARNPTAGFRWTPFLSCKIDPTKVRFRGSFGGSDTPMSQLMQMGFEKYDTKVPHWFFAWHGLYSNYYYQFKAFNRLWRFWIGWKIQPHDVNGVSKYRKNGAGFATQFKRVLVYE